MKPNIFIVGPSGHGKSTSLRNLSPDSTAILNTEQKALPFRGANKFKMNVPIPDMEKYWLMFEKAMSSEKVENLVIESFTSLSENQMRESKKFFTGFDMWSNYKENIGKLLHKSKNTDKYVIFTGIDQVLEDESGVAERFIAVEGSWKKKVEKEFVIVLFANTFTNESGEIEHCFITNKMKGFENVIAKSPMGMFPLTIPNDINIVIDYIEKYYNDEEEKPDNHTLHNNITIEELKGTNN